LSAERPLAQVLIFFALAAVCGVGAVITVATVVKID
jgi:hypothetical protein